jgi:uncharacterized DUF497 family protein
MEFRWNEWNIDHVAKHGIDPEEAEEVLRNARRPYPRDCGAGRWIVWGRGRGGRFLQVIYVLDDDDAVYVIHARPLTEREKWRHRRSRRGEV